MVCLLLLLSVLCALILINNAPRLLLRIKLDIHDK